MQQQLRKITRILYRIVLIIASILTIAICVATLPYALFTNIYDVPNAKPFMGDTWYNPYSQLDFSDYSVWKKSNFHGHTKAWEGFTDGHSDHHMFDSVYRTLGYHTIGISNYQFIDSLFKQQSGYVPCYEHGYNVWKRHHVCIGAHSVVWLDFLFGQSIHHKQTILDHLRPTMDVLTIAHPRFRGSFDPEDFTALSGYDCIEVLNHYRISEEQWDAALSSGHPAWIIGDDDTHNVLAEGETGVCWTMIHAPGTASRSEITSALKKGKAFGVTGNRGRVEIYPIRIEVLQDSLYHIALSDTATKIELIGQGGKVLQSKKNTNDIVYAMKQSDSYVRAKIHGDSSILWMNPILRGDGIDTTRPTINSVQTMLYRSMWWMGYGLIIIGYVFLKRRKR